MVVIMLRLLIYYRSRKRGEQVDFYELVFTNFVFLSMKCNERYRDYKETMFMVLLVGIVTLIIAIVAIALF